MPARRFTDSQEAEFARRYLNGESLRSLAREFAAGHTMLAHSLRRQGVPQRDAPERNRLYTLNPHVFDVIDSEAKAYWLGFLFADGNVSRRSLIVGLAAIDRPHLANLAMLLESNGPIANRVSSNGHATVYFTVTDRHLAERLRELGICPHRPDPLATFDAIPAHLTRHWIRGFFDGDGTIKLKAQAMFCGPYTLLGRIQETLAPATGKQGSLYPHSKGNVWYLSYSGRPSCIALAEYLYHDATIFLERKRLRFAALPAPAANWWERPAPMAAGKHQ